MKSFAAALYFQVDLNFSFINWRKENVNEMKMMNENPKYILLFFGFIEKLWNIKISSKLLVVTFRSEKDKSFPQENIKNFVNSF